MNSPNFVNWDFNGDGYYGWDPERKKHDFDVTGGQAKIELVTGPPGKARVSFLIIYPLADAKSIDECMKLGCNHPMGPLALADLVGLDIVLAILESLHREFGDPRYRPCSLLRKKVEAGWLGPKTGRGFYTY